MSNVSRPEVCYEPMSVLLVVVGNVGNTAYNVCARMLLYTVSVGWNRCIVGELCAVTKWDENH